MRGNNMILAIGVACVVLVAFAVVLKLMSMAF